MNVEELEGAALDAAVAKAAGIKVSMWGDKPCIDGGGGMPGSDVTAWEPSTNWAQGGPIIQRERISVVGEWDHKWWRAGLNAEMGSCERLDHSMYGPTPLIAAMRAYIAANQNKG